eukprot:COSAG02_NODE_1122_length_14450_cov_4.124173_4_plen_334_part_00
MYDVRPKGPCMRILELTQDVRRSDELHAICTDFSTRYCFSSRVVNMAVEMTQNPQPRAGPKIWEIPGFRILHARAAVERCMRWPAHSVAGCCSVRARGRRARSVQVAFHACWSAVGSARPAMIVHLQLGDGAIKNLEIEGHHTVAHIREMVAALTAVHPEHQRLILAAAEGGRATELLDDTKTAAEHGFASQANLRLGERPLPKIVMLDVGGVKHTTLLSTLREVEGSRLEKMFDGVGMSVEGEGKPGVSFTRNPSLLVICGVKYILIALLASTGRDVDSVCAAGSRWLLRDQPEWGGVWVCVGLSAGSGGSQGGWRWRGSRGWGVGADPAAG